MNKIFVLLWRIFWVVWSCTFKFNWGHQYVPNIDNEIISSADQNLGGRSFHTLFQESRFGSIITSDKQHLTQPRATRAADCDAKIICLSKCIKARKWFEDFVKFLDSGLAFWKWASPNWVRKKKHHCNKWKRAQKLQWILKTLIKGSCSVLRTVMETYLITHVCGKLSLLQPLKAQPCTMNFHVIFMPLQVCVIQRTHLQRLIELHQYICAHIHGFSLAFFLWRLLRSKVVKIQQKLHTHYYIIHIKKNLCW